MAGVGVEELQHMMRGSHWNQSGDSWGSERTWIVISENSSLQRELVAMETRRSVVVFGAILSAWSVVLNVLLCLVISCRLRAHTSAHYDWRSNRTYSYPTGRGPLHWLVLNFAAGQTVMAAVIVPLSILTEVHGHWPLGGAACKMWLLVQMALVSFTLWSLFAIIMERFVSTLWPGKVGGRRGRAVAVGCGVAGPWVAAALCVSPVAAMMAQQEDFLLEEMCAIGMTIHNAFVISFLIFFTPAILGLTALGAHLFTLGVTRGRSTVHRRRNPELLGPGERLPEVTPQTTPEVTPKHPFVAPPDDDDTFQSFSEEGKGEVVAAHAPCSLPTSPTCTHAVVMVTYIACAVCWAPFYVTNLLIPFCDVMCVDPSLWTLFLWLGYSSSGISPIVWLLEPRIRNAVKSILRGKGSRYRTYDDI